MAFPLSAKKNWDGRLFSSRAPPENPSPPAMGLAPANDRPPESREKPKIDDGSCPCLCMIWLAGAGEGRRDAREFLLDPQGDLLLGLTIVRVPGPLQQESDVAGPGHHWAPLRHGKNGKKVGRFSVSYE
jgi:hypothetical protein